MRAHWLALAALVVLSGCSVPAVEETPPQPAPPVQAEEPVSVPPVEAREPQGSESPSEPEPPVPEEPEPPVETEPPAPEEFVLVSDYIPDILVDLKYATEDNFTGQVIYSFSQAWLRYGTVEKLAQAQAALAEQGYGLLIWDAFRPVEAQFTLWDVCPDSTYVANPNRGYSSHSRGNTVDLTLVALDGGEVAMPTGFDDFTALADRDYSDADPVAASHAQMLEDAMTAAGFKPYFGEWWHFSDTDVYGVEETFAP